MSLNNWNELTFFVFGFLSKCRKKAPSAGRPRGLGRRRGSRVAYRPRGAAGRGEAPQSTGKGGGRRAGGDAEGGGGRATVRRTRLTSMVSRRTPPVASVSDRGAPRVDARRGDAPISRPGTCRARRLNGHGAAGDAATVRRQLRGARPRAGASSLLDYMPRHVIIYPKQQYHTLRVLLY